jgi:hypothetical protein
MDDFKTNAWFSGFADGEAHFGLPRQTNRPAIVPMFEIQLRADDLAILERLQEVFGGYLRVREINRGNPAAGWSVGSKRDLIGLVDYFDRFPLRAKKANDYAIWRRAVLVYLERGAMDPEMAILRQALIAGRVYAALEVEYEDPEPPLRLFGLDGGLA